MRLSHHVEKISDWKCVDVAIIIPPRILNFEGKRKLQHSIFLESAALLGDRTLPSSCARPVGQISKGFLRNKNYTLQKSMKRDDLWASQRPFSLCVRERV